MHGISSCPEGMVPNRNELFVVIAIEGLVVHATLHRGSDEVSAIVQIEGLPSFDGITVYVDKHVTVSLGLPPLTSGDFTIWYQRRINGNQRG